MTDLLIRIISKYNKKGTEAAKKDFKAAKKEISSVGREIGAGLGLGLVVSEINQFTAESVSLAREQAKAEAQVAAVITSTGMAARLTLGELKNHAAALQSVTNFGDEATLGGQALLLTFTNIGRDVFPQATETMLDMSAALGQDLKSSALQLGKALNDPIRGVTALREVGVSFSDAQVKVIKELAETNRVAEAQALILKELGREFGGSAKAAREADGGFIAVSNSFGDMQEAIGALILEMNDATNATDILIAGFDKLAAGANAWRDAIPLFKQTGELIGSKINPLLAQGILAVADAIGGEELQDKIKGFAKTQVERIDAAKEEISEVRQAGKDEAIVTEVEQDEELIALQRDFARDVIDIQSRSDEDLKEAAGQLASDMESAAEDNADRLSDIRRDAAKDRLKIEKNFKKDLAKIDTDLKKELEKSTQDEIKKVAKAEQGAAKTAKQERRVAAVDALADQRLFDLALRNLAADGQGIAIQQALERRAIEEQIAREKGEVEKQIEQENKKDQIATIRSEGNERRAQLQADAKERKAILETRNQEEVAELEARVIAELQSERENFIERRSELQQFYEDRVGAIEEGEAKSIDELGRGLAEMEELTTSQFGELTQLAALFGEETGKQFADGLSAGFAENSRIDTLLGQVGSGQVSMSTPLPPLSIAASGSGVQQFQTGGVVSGPIGQPRLAVVEGGEEIANPQAGQSITIGGETFVAREAGRLANAINAQRQQDMQDLVNTLTESFA